jgi:hypothetical protein
VLDRAKKSSSLKSFLSDVNSSKLIQVRTARVAPILWRSTDDHIEF